MKLKTTELTGAALDWAVATCEGAIYHGPSVRPAFWSWPTLPVTYSKSADGYSADWSKCGPIIEREKIAVVPCGDHWNAAADDQTLEVFPYEGPTALIAAMRCLVTLKLGSEVDVPEELLAPSPPAIRPARRPRI
jgi:hypothetical protein